MHITLLVVLFLLSGCLINSPVPRDPQIPPHTAQPPVIRGQKVDPLVPDWLSWSHLPVDRQWAGGPLLYSNSPETLRAETGVGILYASGQRQEAQARFFSHHQNLSGRNLHLYLVGIGSGSLGLERMGEGKSVYPNIAGAGSTHAFLSGQGARPLKSANPGVVLWDTPLPQGQTVTWTADLQATGSYRIFLLALETGVSPISWLQSNMNRTSAYLPRDKHPRGDFPHSTRFISLPQTWTPEYVQVRVADGNHDGPWLIGQDASNPQAVYGGPEVLLGHFGVLYTVSVPSQDQGIAVVLGAPGQPANQTVQTAGIWASADASSPSGAFRTPSSGSIDYRHGAGIGSWRPGQEIRFEHMVTGGANAPLAYHFYRW